ncbi:probable G-protein coupled receptor 139 [Heptranchias perlo]|uniref:probable G-protein coupled receptor 139 n=1 Tax=Heptranchias perlo TaxID=212740 RepID=UPI00355976A8
MSLQIVLEYNSAAADGQSASFTLLVILILSRGKCGLSRCISCYLLSMAAADLTVILTAVILDRIVTLYFIDIFTESITMCGLGDCLTHAATDCSVWFTVAFTFDRFVAICCQKLKTKYCTARTAAVVLGTVSVLSCLKSIPWYFRYKVIYLFSMPMYCLVRLSYYTSPLWKAFDYFHRALTPVLPFVLILLLNALTVRHILLASRVRRGLQGKRDRENHKDTEMENRRKSIVLLFSISASFILLWMIQAVSTIHERIVLNQFTDIIFGDHLPGGLRYIGPILQLLSSCSNTCIYVVTQTKVKQEFKTVLTYPFVLIVHLRIWSQTLTLRHEVHSKRVETDPEEGDWYRPLPGLSEYGRPKQQQPDRLNTSVLPAFVICACANFYYKMASDARHAGNVLHG